MPLPPGGTHSTDLCVPGDLSRQLERLHDPRPLLLAPPGLSGARPWLCGTDPDSQRRARALFGGQTAYHPDDVPQWPLRLLRGELSQSLWTVSSALDELAAQERQAMIHELPWLEPALLNAPWSAHLTGPRRADTQDQDTVAAARSFLLTRLRLTPWQGSARLLRDLRQCGREPGLAPWWTQGVVTRHPRFWRRRMKRGDLWTLEQLSHWRSGAQIVTLRQWLSYRHGPAHDPVLNAGHQLRLTLRVA